MLVQSKMIKLGGSGTGYAVPSWSRGTDDEIREALQMHYEGEIDLTQYWSVGDKRKVRLSAMEAMPPLTDAYPETEATFVLANAGGKAYPTYQCYRIGEGAQASASVSIVGIVPYRDTASVLTSNNTYNIPDTPTSYKSLHAEINGETVNSRNLIYEKYSAPVYAAKKRYEQKF